MCDQIPAQYSTSETWISIPAQPTLPSTGSIKPDSDVEARVTLFMQTTGRGLQGQYWRKSAFELSKWLTAQIQYERQGWQLKLQTALKEIENYRREALMADKALSDSLDLLLHSMDTCAISYNSQVPAVSSKKQLLTEYVEVLTEILKFLIQERSLCFCLMGRKPDIEMNLVECIHQFIDAERKSKREAKCNVEKQEELHTMISDLRNELDTNQKVETTCENWIPTNYFQKQPNSFTVRKYKKRRFGSVSPLLTKIETNTLKSNTIPRLKLTDCADEEEKKKVSLEQKPKNLPEKLKSLNTKEYDKNGKCYIVSHPINVTETIMKQSEDSLSSDLAETAKTLRCEDSSSAIDSRTLYSLPPIKLRQIKDFQKKIEMVKGQMDFAYPPVPPPPPPPPPQVEPATSKTTTAITNLQQQQEHHHHHHHHHQQHHQHHQTHKRKVKLEQECSRCKCIYLVKENQKLSCCFHPKGKKRVEKLDETGKLIKSVFIWQCCNRSLESTGCTLGFHT